MFDTALAALQDSAVAQGLRSSIWIYPLINAGHIIGLALLFGAIVPLDLRLLGAWRSVPLGSIARPVLPVATAGFFIAVGSGICMLATNGTEYIGNPFLPLKFGFIGLGLINVAVVNQLKAWKQRAAGPPTQRGERQLALVGGVSLVCWLAAVTCGRMIGYW
jgi:hypothetical protein